MHYESVIIIRAISLLLVILSLIGVIYVAKIKRLGWCAVILPILLLLNTGLYYFDRILYHGFGVSLLPIGGASLIHPWSILLRLQTALTFFAAVALYIAHDKTQEEKTK